MSASSQPDQSTPASAVQMPTLEDLVTISHTRAGTEFRPKSGCYIASASGRSASICQMNGCTVVMGGGACILTINQQGRSYTFTYDLSSNTCMPAHTNTLGGISGSSGSGTVTLQGPSGIMRFTNCTVSGVPMQSVPVQKDSAGNISCTKCTDCVSCRGCKRCTGCVDCRGCKRCTNCKDCRNSKRCTNCVDCRDCVRCYDCKACTDCTDCSGCTDCTDCFDCTDCIGCSGVTGGKGLRDVHL